MLRRCLFICAALIIGACSACGAGSASLRSRYADDLLKAEYENAAIIEVQCVYPAPATGTMAELIVVLMGGLPKGGWGSGAAVGPGSLITARHVVDCDLDLPLDAGTLNGEAMKITVTTRAGVKFEAVVEEIGDGESDDFARLVAVDGAEPFEHWARVRQTNPRIGEQVCVMSAYPWYARRCGAVSDYGAGLSWMGGGYMIYDLPSDPGNSGSGVYDSEGYLVAIHVASVGRHAGGGYAVGRWRGRVPEGYADLGF